MGAYKAFYSFIRVEVDPKPTKKLIFMLGMEPVKVLPISISLMARSSKMSSIRVEYPLFGAVSIEVPDAVAEDKQLASDLIRQHFTRCSVMCCIMVGFIGAMLFAAGLIWINDSIVEKKFAYRVIELEKQVQQYEASNKELRERVDTLLASVVTKDGTKLIEDAKQTVSAQLSTQVDDIVKAKLSEVKERLANAGKNKYYPEGVQVNRYLLCFKGEFDRANEFMKTQANIIDIQTDSDDLFIFYLPEDKIPQ